MLKRKKFPRKPVAVHTGPAKLAGRLLEVRFRGWTDITIRGMYFPPWTTKAGEIKRH